MKNHYNYKERNFFNTQEYLEKLKQDTEIIITNKLLDLSHSIEEIKNNFLEKFRSSLESTVFLFLQELQSQNTDSLRKLIHKQFFSSSEVELFTQQDKETITKILSKLSQRMLQKLIV